MEFFYLTNLLEKKYLGIEGEDVKVFLKYFISHWREKLPGWYEGYAQFHPSTNNGLESTNRWIKANQFREKLPLNEFLSVFLSLPTKWSAERKIEGRKNWNSQPNIELSKWTEACQWSQKVQDFNTSILFTEDGVKRIHSSNMEKIDIELLKNFVDIWSVNCFDTYKSVKNSFFSLTVVGENVSCDCISFKKNYICSHSLGTKIILKLVTAPAEAWAIPLGQKRKPGRPKKAGPALSLI
jgi:hypothetical protein